MPGSASIAGGYAATERPMGAISHRGFDIWMALGGSRTRRTSPVHGSCPSWDASVVAHQRWRRPAACRHRKRDGSDANALTRQQGPDNMGNPPVPDSWADTIREQFPPYRPAVTPTQGMGAIAECFRTYPAVHRSDHPQHSFAACGTDAEAIAGGHAYDTRSGKPHRVSVYDRAGRVLFLGTSHATNTSLHLAEYRADIDADTTKHARPIAEGEREWRQWTDIELTERIFRPAAMHSSVHTPAPSTRENCRRRPVTTSDNTIVDFVRVADSKSFVGISDHGAVPGSRARLTVSDARTHSSTREWPARLRVRTSPRRSERGRASRRR